MSKGERGAPIEDGTHQGSHLKKCEKGSKGDKGDKGEASVTNYFRRKLGSCQQ